MPDLIAEQHVAPEAVLHLPPGGEAVAQAQAMLADAELLRSLSQEQREAVASFEADLLSPESESLADETEQAEAETASEVEAAAEQATSESYSQPAAAANEEHLADAGLQLSSDADSAVAEADPSLQQGAAEVEQAEAGEQQAPPAADGEADGVEGTALASGPAEQHGSSAEPESEQRAEELQPASPRSARTGGRWLQVCLPGRSAARSGATCPLSLRLAFV